uniref:Putative conserved secreted protein n=1 Tax=Phlebotomus kandelakii TaxID=1109342 RepID=A0A6B2EAS7_9DIPT
MLEIVFGLLGIFFSWYYVLAAFVLFALAYIVEVELDLPLQDEECPGVAHVNLKRVIQKVIEEALNLPDLFDFSGYPPRPESHLPYFSTKKYEQLLATAVLNKVIDHYRNPKNHQENSSGIQSGSELDSNHNPVPEKTGLLSPGQKALDKRLEEASQGSESSLKTRSTESDETYLSDYIQKHRVPLPDLSAASSESTAEDVSEVASTAGTEGTWEENWLFKKRKVKTETNSTAIGMLVPSPTEEVKALIGDKNVDEVSDLSEAGSDAEEDTQDRPAAKLLESKTIIGGKNDLISLEETSSATESLLSNPDSGINVTEAKNEALLDHDFPEPIQAFNGAMEAPIPTPRQSTVSENHVSKPEPEMLSQSPEPDSLEDEHLIPGSIAEREHLKWQHPDADIPNNPYSPEALQKRLVVKTYQSQSSTTSTTSHIESPPKTPERSLQVVLGENSPDHKRYGRDYYINDAKRSSGTRKKMADSSMSEEDKVSEYSENPLNDSYILNKFLGGTLDFARNTKLRRSTSLKSFRTRVLDDLEVHSVDRRVRKMKSFRPTPKELSSFEAQMLHNDLRRNSFRSLKGTSNFVLNPIFDDPTEEEDMDPLQRLKSTSSVSVLDTRLRDSDTESDVSWRFFAGEGSECVETVFDDLNSLRGRSKKHVKHS